MESKQPRLSDDLGARALFYRSVERWVESAALTAPAYGGTAQRYRDEFLRAFWMREPHLAGVLNSVVDIDKNRGWQIVGGRNQVALYSQVLRQAEATAFDERGVPVAGKGWRYYFSQQSLAYYTADLGAVTEVGRDAPDGPMRALWSVDPARCDLTGSLEYPLAYYPASGQKQDWKQSDFMRAVSMPSTDETLNGLGYCAVSRILEMAQIMVAVYRHDKEMLGAMMPKGILLMRGITDQMWTDAMETHAERLTAKEREYYAGLSILFGDEALDAKLVALSSLPEGFDLKVVTDLLMYTYALSFGYDPREFWPVSSGSLGTATESEVMAWKATGKGGLDFALAYQDNIQREMPPTLLFEFEHRNDQGEIEEAKKYQAWADAIQKMAAPSGNGLPPTLTDSEKRQLYAQHGMIPEEWTIEEEDVTATDTDELERLMDTLPNVRRAIAAFPDEPIVKYSWPSGVRRTLYDPNKIRPSFFLVSGIERTIAQVTRQYRDDLTNAVYGAWGGGSQAQLRNTHKALIRSLAPEAYAEGMREGGVDPSEMDAQDKATIKEWVAGQLPFVNEFAKAVKEADGDEQKRAAILGRIELWVGALANLGALGLASAQKNAMVTWRLNAIKNTNEHCPTCEWLDGQRHRRRWFAERGYLPGEVGSSTLECGGWECGCGFVKDNGDVFRDAA